MLRRHPVELELDNAIGARPGQGVMVGLAESVYLALVWRAYGMPLLGGLAGAVVCHQILKQVAVGSALLDLGSLAAGIAMGALSWRWFSRRALNRLDSHPVQLIETLEGQTACAGRQTLAQ
jgi:positive regulator of sigma E activity